MKKENKITKLVLIIAFALLIILNLSLLIFNYRTIKSIPVNLTINNEDNTTFKVPSLNISNDPLSLEGFSPVNTTITDKSIVLTANCTSLGLLTNDIQLYSIRQGVTNSIDVRPTIHDITKSVLDNFNISILMVKVVDGQGEIFFSNLYLKEGNNLLNIDSKPSDSIALALRARAPIYINTKLLEQYGNKTC